MELLDELNTLIQMAQDLSIKDQDNEQTISDLYEMINHIKYIIQELER